MMTRLAWVAFVAQLTIGCIGDRASPDPDPTPQRTDDEVRIRLYPYDLGTTELYCGAKQCGRVVVVGQKLADWDEDACIITKSTGMAMDFVKFPLVHPHPDATNVADLTYTSKKGVDMTLAQLEKWCTSLNERADLTTVLIDVDYLANTKPPSDDPLGSMGVYKGPKNEILYWHETEFPRLTWSCPHVKPIRIREDGEAPSWTTKASGSARFSKFKKDCGQKTIGAFCTQYNSAEAADQPSASVCSMSR